MRGVYLLAALSLLAGCMGGSKADAPAPSLDAVPLGSVEGRVVDEEQVPLGNVTVRLLEPGVQALTDGDGVFRIADVVAGSHTLAVDFPEHASFRQSVAVVAEETVNVTVLLQRVAVKVPHVEVLPFEGYIQYGNEYADVLARTLGQNGCTKCRFSFSAAAGVEALVSEIQFTRTLDNPHGPEVLAYALFNQDMSIRYTPAGQYWPSGGKFELERRWSDSGAGFVHTHGCDDLWICVDQTFTNYVSLFHHQGAPFGYSALAKPG